MRAITVTAIYEVDGEVVKEDTYPLLGLKEVAEVGCPPIEIAAVGLGGEIAVRFSFEPPLKVPR